MKTLQKSLSLLVLFACLSYSTSAQTLITFYTNQGDFVVEMTENLSPITSGNFIDLANAGFYDGIIFHRIIDDFVIQGGDPTGTGAGGSGVIIEDEFGEGLSNLAGTLSMANSGPNSGTSQFFINLVNNTFLDHDVAPLSSAHPVFGRVFTNFNIVQEIGAVPVNALDQPLDAVVMDSVRVLTSDTTLPLAYWSLNEGETNSEGASIIQGIGNGINSVDNRFEQEGQATLFSGSAFIDAGDHLDEFFIREDQAISIAAWVKTIGVGSEMVIVSKHLPNSCAENQEQFYLAIAADGGVAFNISGSSDGADALLFESAPGLFSAGDEWKYVAFTYDPSIDTSDGLDRAQLYIDNEAVELELTREGSLFSAATENTAHLAVGAFVDENGESCGGNFIGILDELYIFNQVLSPAELEDLSAADGFGSGIADVLRVANVFPNPVDGQVLKIELPDFQKVEALLSSVDGKLMASHKLEGASLSISLSDLASGIYFLQILGDGINEVHEIVVK